MKERAAVAQCGPPTEMISVWVLGCVRFEGMPDMPPGTASDPSIYGSEKGVFNKNVMNARFLVRTANLTWTLSGTAGERLANERELRERFAGVIFVGDSQIREVAWSALQMLLPQHQLGFAKTDRVFAKQRPPSRSACVPQSVGKTGFTATCDTSTARCELHSPFHNKSHAELMRRLLLTKPHAWDGKLSVSETVCNSDFFVSYQATWGAMPIEPRSIPSCLHPDPTDRDDKYALRNPRTGQTRPVLWVVDGCGLHEMEFCDERRNELPQNAFARFPAALLRSGTVVYQTVGAGFLMRSSRRFRGACQAIDADQIAAKERVWLAEHGVRYYNYSRLALQYAPLMFDAIHFTYYWVPCAQTFPEMARLVAQLAFQQAVGRPVEVCQPGTMAKLRDVEAVAANHDAAAMNAIGVARLSLKQDAESSQRALSSALKLSGGGVGKLKHTQPPSALPGASISGHHFGG